MCGELKVYNLKYNKKWYAVRLHTIFYFKVMFFYRLTRSLTCSEGSYNPGRVLVCGLNLPHLISKQGE